MAEKTYTSSITDDFSAPGVYEAHDVVSFFCKNCGNALKLDLSILSAPDKNLLQEITAPLYNSDQVAAAAAAGFSQHQITLEPIEYTTNHCKLHSSTSRSNSRTDDLDFMLVKRVGEGSEQSVVGGLLDSIEVKTKLFDLLSSQAEIDHPLCEDCTEVVLNDLGNELKAAEEECTAYKELLEQLETEKLQDGTGEDYDLILKQLQAEERELMEKMKETDDECRKLDSELLIEAGKQNDLKQEEEDFLKEYNELKKEAHELECESRSAENQCQYSQSELARLVDLNAFNSTFHIWYIGHFGTINGFRLGRLPNIPVDWNEINNAWGQTVLLFHSITRKMNFTFQRYKLVPYGSHSYIETLSDKPKDLPLYCTGGYKFFSDKKFDQAMVAFLDCLQQFTEEVQRRGGTFIFPYTMSNGKIIDKSGGSVYSIKLQFNSDEQWTKALKFMLTNLKWGLTWLITQCPNHD